jgi:hypothetical protein
VELIRAALNGVVAETGLPAPSAEFLDVSD